VSNTDIDLNNKSSNEDVTIAGVNEIDINININESLELNDNVLSTLHSEHESNSLCNPLSTSLQDINIYNKTKNNNETKNKLSKSLNSSKTLSNKTSSINNETKTLQNTFKRSSYLNKTNTNPIPKVNPEKIKSKLEK